MNLPQIHQLPEWEDAGYAPSIEYSLPIGSIFEDLCQDLDPWMASIATLAPDQAAVRMQERWTNSRHGLLEGILQYFLQYRPRSIVIREHKSWLLCELRESEVRSSDCFLLPGPIDVSALDDRLAKIGFTNPQLVELISVLAGLREDFEPGGGAFLEASGDWILINQPWMAGVLTNYDDWRNSLIVFNSRGGDGLVVHPTGRVGWWNAGDVVVKSYATDLSDLCRKFADYKSLAWVNFDGCDKLIAWPFDGHWRKFER